MRIIQMFNWNLQDIEKIIDIISEQGFDAIQINPIQPLKEDNPSIWWLSYQPCGFKIGNIYGSKQDLINLCNIANNYGVKIIADVVLDHTAGANDGSLNPHEKVDKKLTSNRDFWKPRKNIGNWQNRYEVTHYCMGLPGLNPWNHDLQDIMIKFLNELLDCGVAGFRFDAAKNIALPDEGCDFWARIIKKLNKDNPDLYGEIIFEKQDLFDRYGEFFKILTNNDPQDRNNTIKFCESHDSYYEFGYTKNIPSNVIAYQYKKLTNDYPHTLLYVRPFDEMWKSPIIKEANYQKVK